MHLYGGRVSSAGSGQHKKQEPRVTRLQAEHRKTYLFLGSSTQNPEQEKTEQGDMNGEGKSKEGTEGKKDKQKFKRKINLKKKNAIQRYE